MDFITVTHTNMAQPKFPHLQSLNITTNLYNKMVIGGNVVKLEALIAKYPRLRDSKLTDELFGEKIVRVEELIRKYPILEHPKLTDAQFAIMVSTILNFNNVEMNCFSYVMLESNLKNLVNLDFEKLGNFLANINVMGSVAIVIYGFTQIPNFKHIKIMNLICGSPNKIRLLASTRVFSHLLNANVDCGSIVKVLEVVSNLNKEETEYYLSNCHKFHEFDEDHELMAQLIINITGACKVEKMMIQYPDFIKSSFPAKLYFEMIIAISKFNLTQMDYFHLIMGKYRNFYVIPTDQIVMLIVNIPDYSFHPFVGKFEALINKCATTKTEGRDAETLQIIKNMIATPIVKEPEVILIKETTISKESEVAPIKETLTVDLPKVSESNDIIDINMGNVADWNEIKLTSALQNEEQCNLVFAKLNEIFVKFADDLQLVCIKRDHIVNLLRISYEISKKFNVEKQKPQQNEQTPKVEEPKPQQNEQTPKVEESNTKNNVSPKSVEALEIERLKKRNRMLLEKNNQTAKKANANSTKSAEIISKKNDTIDYLLAKIAFMENNELELINGYGKVNHCLKLKIEMKNEEIMLLKNEMKSEEKK